MPRRLGESLKRLTRPSGWLVPVLLLSGHAFTAPGRSEPPVVEGPYLLGPPGLELPPPPAPWSQAAWDDRLAVSRWQAQPPAGSAEAQALWLSQDPVLAWGHPLLLRLASLERPDPPRAARTLALFHATCHDVSVAVWQARAQHRRPGPARRLGAAQGPGAGSASEAIASYPDHGAAVAAAASRLLGALFPEAAQGLQRQADAVAWLGVAAGQAYPSDIRAGWQIGQAVAVRALQRLQRDPLRLPASARTPARWALSPEAAHWQCWSRPAPPPLRAPEESAARRAEWRRAVDQLGIRERAIAMKWLRQDMAQHWYVRAAALARKEKLAGPELARVMAGTSLALSDAAVTCWALQARFKRPQLATQLPGFRPLLPAPDHPGFPADTAAMAQAAATYLGSVFPLARAGLAREAGEAAEAAIFAGWGDRLDRDAGVRVGEAVGQAVIRLTSRLDHPQHEAPTRAP
ncbi:MAG: hypothetical protein VKP62_10175 [Candidatus Sericytochromatia bacterium]|nr:hypothetical protein [Candidatus Sericytochromatia bacterium]